MLDPIGYSVFLGYGASTEINNSEVELEVKHFQIMLYGKAHAVSEAEVSRSFYVSFHNAVHTFWHGMEKYTFLMSSEKAFFIPLSGS